MRISNYKEEDKSKINKFLEEHNEQFFQSLEAYYFFSKVDNYRPIFLYIEDDNEVLASINAVIIKESGFKSFFSKRSIVFGNPVLKDNNKEALNLILEELDRIASKKAIYTEFRNFINTDEFKDTYIKNGFKYLEHLNYIVETPDFDKTKAAISKSRKRQINKSIKNGAEIIEAENINQVKSFYEILETLYKEKVKKPIANFDLFEEFYNNKNLGKYFLIKYENKIIGGIMCPIYKETIYEWFICGLDGEINNVYPSVLATWAPIEYAANNNLKYFDFMGAGKPDEDYGVREFKSKFGGELVEYGRYHKINQNIMYKIGLFGLKIISKLK